MSTDKYPDVEGSRTTGPLTAGMVMLAVGLVGLGGFGLVTAARSRALARRSA